MTSMAIPHSHSLPYRCLAKRLWSADPKRGRVWLCPLWLHTKEPLGRQPHAQAPSAVLLPQEVSPLGPPAQLSAPVRSRFPFLVSFTVTHSSST